MYEYDIRFRFTFDGEECEEVRNEGNFDSRKKAETAVRKRLRNIAREEYEDLYIYSIEIYNGELFYDYTDYFMR